MQAYIIHAMANGQFVESGTHSELLTQAGRYPQMKESKPYR